MTKKLNQKDRSMQKVDFSSLQVASLQTKINLNFEFLIKDSTYRVLTKNCWSKLATDLTVGMGKYFESKLSEYVFCSELKLIRKQKME